METRVADEAQRSERQPRRCQPFVADRLRRRPRQPRLRVVVSAPPLRERAAAAPQRRGGKGRATALTRFNAAAPLLPMTRGWITAQLRWPLSAPSLPARRHAQARPSCGARRLRPQRAPSSPQGGAGLTPQAAQPLRGTPTAAGASVAQRRCETGPAAASHGCAQPQQRRATDGRRHAVPRGVLPAAERAGMLRGLLWLRCVVRKRKKKQRTPGLR
jgi:hypothetical protein